MCWPVSGQGWGWLVSAPWWVKLVQGYSAHILEGRASAKAQGLLGLVSPPWWMEQGPGPSSGCGRGLQTTWLLMGTTVPTPSLWV